MIIRWWNHRPDNLLKILMLERRLEVVLVPVFNAWKSTLSWHICFIKSARHCEYLFWNIWFLWILFKTPEISFRMMCIGKYWGIKFLLLYEEILLMGGVVFPPCYLTWGPTVVELMNIMRWTSFKRSKHALLHSVPPALQQALASTRDSWTLTGKSGSVSCGVTAPLSWVLVHTKFCLCPPRVCFPSPV